MLRKSLLAVCLFSLLAALSFVNVLAQDCPGGVVTLRVDDWSSGDRVEYMNQVVDAFEAENPCISVVLEPNIGDDQNTRRLTWLAAGTAPDLMAYPPEWAALYMEESEGQAYIDLTPYIEGENGLDPAAEFYEGVFQQGFYDGKPVALAKDYSTSAFYVNTALFEAAGIPLPEEGWTWDDALDIALQLTLDANGNNAASPDFDPENVVQWGIDVVSDGWWRGFQSYLLSWGTPTITDDGMTTSGILNSETTAEALAWYRDLVFTHHVAPGLSIIGATEGGRVQMFQDGKIAMGVTFHGPWWQDVFNETPNLEWAVVPLPGGPGGRGSAVMWLGWGVSGQSQHPEEAWKLLKWFATEPGQRVFALKALSGSRVVSQEQQREDDPYWGVFIAETNHLKALDDVKTPYYGPCVATPAGDLTVRLLSEGGDALDIQAELDKVAAEADACIAESAAGSS